MSYNYKPRDCGKFVEFRPRYVGFDPLTRIIASVDDYPYTSVIEFDKIESNFFKKMFTTDGVVGLIRHPTTSKLGLTKYIITRNPVPPENYKIVCCVDNEGTITCKMMNFIQNPKVTNISFVLMIKQNYFEDIDYGLYGFQTERNYNYKEMVVEIIKKFNLSELNLKDFMKMRHDVFQTYICVCFGLTLHLGETLRLSDYGIVSNQTPDFFEVDGNQCLVGDITITSDSTLGMATKINKYQKLMGQLLKKYKVIPVFISFDNDFYNFGQQMSNIPLKRIFRDESFEANIGNFANMFDSLRRTYPHDFEEHTGIRYPIIDPPIDSTYTYIKDNLQETVEEEIMEIFSEEVLSAYKDEKFDVEDIHNSYNVLKTLNTKFKEDVKPSHYVPIPPDDGGLKTIHGQYSEQNMLINFFSLTSIKDNVFKEISNALLTTLSSFPMCKKMFMEGVWLDDQDVYKDEYHSGNKNISFEQFLRSKQFLLPKPGENKIPYQKMIQLSAETQSSINIFLEKSGQDFRKKNLVREHSPKTTCNIETSYIKTEQFLDLLSTETDRDWGENFFEIGGQDLKFVENIKKEYSNMAKCDLKNLSDLYCFKYLRYSSLMFEQLIHFSNLSMSKKRFAIFNSGIPNICGVMRCGYRGMAQQVGKPFMFFGVTKSQEFITSGMFGNLHVEEMKNGCYYFRTKWFRLPTFRLEFFRDQYYSILSSSLATLARIRNIGISHEQIRGTFCLRTLVGLMANQKAMEKLADSRYAIMSCFATHTNFRELIIEKFSPPYKSYVEGWIVYKILHELPSFRDAVYDSNNIRINMPILDHLDRRFQQSTGGTFNIKAVWSNRKLYSLQDLLDELFLYVHTPKEPSTAFHEEVNSIKTINKFQELFNQYNLQERCGFHQNVKDWLLQKKQVGFYAPFLFEASKYYNRTMGIDFNRIERIICDENIGELTSTKAVIPDIPRVIKPIDKHFKYRVNDHINLFGKLPEKTLDYLKEHEKKQKDTKFRSTAEVYHGRTKVHDECLSYITHFNESTVLNNAILYYNTKNAKVLTDICIKAQYGAKREFYVMNMGAKVMARVVENFYKEIAKQSDNEMISVPGDRKLMHMQSMMDRTIKHAIKKTNLVSYCNGDCTKWSAAETMEAFHVLTEGITVGWESDFKRVINCIIHAWTKKYIQIPLNIISKVHPLSKETNYLLDASNNNYELPSNQNFLQGVYNYMSSVKADVCNKYTVYLWNKYFNQSNKFYVEYLVHSDDYVFSFSSPTQEIIDEFRAFHKVCMKMCGITDSSKKTNVQPVFMEFISLVCFNGSMSYPTIKKTKEVATTLPCESFTGDSDMVCSRTGECVRVGTDFYSSWMFHKIHMSLLRRAYSMHEGGCNFVNDRYNIPVECFGESDMHPIFYFLSKGDPNNLRIFNYTNNKSILKKLYNIGKHGDKLHNVHASFVKPTFIYNNYTDRIVKVRKNSGIDIQTAMKFWEDNLMYNFIKPKDIKDLKLWLQAMYFKSSFIKAYNRDSRTTRLLRLSLFSRGHCVTYKTDEELNEFYLKLSSIKNKEEKQKYIKGEMFTINELKEKWKEFDEQGVDDRDVQIAILMGDSTPDLIYRWMESTSIRVTEKINTYNTCATFSPFKAAWLGVSQPVDKVLTYAISPDKFYQNYGVSHDLNLLQVECDKLDNALPGVLNMVRDTALDYGTRMKAMQLCYNTYINNLPTFQVCMSSKRHRQNVPDFLTDSFKYLNDPSKISEVVSQVIQIDMNPFTLVRHTILGTERTLSELKQLINNITIAYVYLTTRRHMTEEESLNILRYSNVNFLGTVQTIYDVLKTFSFMKAKEENLNYSELLSFVFFKFGLCHTTTDLRSFMEGKTTFNYSYVKPQRYNSVTKKYEGNMEAHFHVENTFGIVKVVDSRLMIEVDSYNTSKAEISYLIGAKLSSMISENKFYSLCNNRQIKKICTTQKAWSDGLYLVLKDNQLVFDLVYKNNDYIGLPVKFKSDLVMGKKYDRVDKYLLSSNFKIKELSIMLENRKLFSLSFKKMHYTQLEMISDFKDLCLYNDLMAFEVLEHKPLEEHNLVKFCEELHKQIQGSRVKPQMDPITSLSFDIGSIELAFDVNEFNPYIDEFTQFQDDLYDNFDEEEDLLDFIKEEKKRVQEGLGEAQTSPFDRVIAAIELVDTYNNARVNVGNIHTLKNKGDVLTNVVKELLGMNNTFALSPYEYVWSVRIVSRMKQEIDRVPWFETIAEMLEDWLRSSVKLTKMQENIGNYIVRLFNDELKICKTRSLRMGLYREVLRKSDKSYIIGNIDEIGDDEYVTVYTEVKQDEFWNNSPQILECFPFYQKRDEFYNVIAQISIATMDI